MKHLDLFSGIGGFALAMKRIFGNKYENIGHSEIDKNACKIYHTHFKDSKCLGNITKISFSQQDSRVRMQVSQETEKDSQDQKQDYFQNCTELLENLNQNGLCSKMFPDYSLSTMGKICGTSLKSFPKSGIAYAGECLMLNTSESPNDAEGCGLSEVLETHVPLKYYLSRKAVEGMIRRSKQWGRGGYVFLQETENGETRQVKHLSLQQLEQMTTIEETQEQTEILLQKQCLQNPMDSVPIQMTQSSQTQSEQPKEITLPLYGKTLILRKLIPIEKERLMGFPEGWTDLELSDGRRGHGLGNSIVSKCAEWILNRIKCNQRME